MDVVHVSMTIIESGLVAVIAFVTWVQLTAATASQLSDRVQLEDFIKSANGGGYVFSICVAILYLMLSI